MQLGNTDRAETAKEMKINTTVLDALNDVFEKIEARIDEMDDQFDSQDSADPYFEMSDGDKLEYRSLFAQRELVRQAITKTPLPRDIDALNDPNYND